MALALFSARGFLETMNYFQLPRFYVNHETKTTTWEDPRRPPPAATNPGQRLGGRAEQPQVGVRLSSVKISEIRRNSDVLSSGWLQNCTFLQGTVFSCTYKLRLHIVHILVLLYTVCACKARENIFLYNKPTRYRKI